MPTKTDNQSNLDTLADAADHARRQYEEAQAAAEAAREAAEERRAAALAKHDRARLDTYDDSQHEVEVQAALEAVRAAITETPLFKALVDLQVARFRRYYRHTEATGDAARLELSDEERRRRIPSPPYTSSPNMDEVLRMVEQMAGNIAADDEDARFAAREAVGDAAAAKG